MDFRRFTSLVVLSELSYHHWAVRCIYWLLFYTIDFKTIPKADSYIKNSFELVEKLRSLHFTGAHELISLDVTSLFTNVPIDIAVNCVNEQWNFISKDCSLPRDEFLGAIRFVLDSTFFFF